MRTLLVGLGLVTGSALAQPPVPYPDDYRDWTHIKSMVIEQGHPLYEAFGGVHHIYANAAGVAGYRGEGPFPDGAVLVFDLLGAERAENAITEGTRKVLGVMHKDSEAYAATGGWGFEGFGGGEAGDRVVGDQAAAACFGCHASRAGDDYVFSEWRD